MKGDYEKLLNQLQDSLNLSIYPTETLQRYGKYGLEFFKYLVSLDCFLPFFAATDIVCSFFEAHKNYSQILPYTQLKIKDKSFNENYRKHIEFLRGIMECPPLKMIGTQIRILCIFEKEEQLEMEQDIYEAYKFFLAEKVFECPFATLKPIYNYRHLKEICWNSLKLPPNDRFQQECFTKEIFTNLQSLDFEKTGKGVILEEGKKDKLLMECLTETVFRGYQEKINSNQKKKTDYSRKGEKIPDNNTQLKSQETKNFFETSLLQHLFDYKLVDLYMEYYDDYEPSEQLRHKIALLDYISRLAILKSPLISEFSRQWMIGTPNPAFLGQGWERFFLKMLEGGFVFLGNPDPIYDQDNVAIRFFMIEEIKSLNEKIKKHSDEPPRFTHINIHKLFSLLTSHDLVKYLGKISKMDILMNFLSYNRGSNIPLRFSEEMSIKSLRREHIIKEGFMVKNKAIQRAILYEPNSIETHVTNFDEHFFNNFFNVLNSSSINSSLGFNRTYDIFFSRGGTFLYENDAVIFQNITKAEDENCFQLEEFNPSPGLRDFLLKKSYQIMPNHSRSFILETNHQYLLVKALNNCFKTQVIDHNLKNFLCVAREYFLTLITEEAISFRLGYIKRMNG